MAGWKINSLGEKKPSGIYMAYSTFTMATSPKSVCPVFLKPKRTSVPPGCPDAEAILFLPSSAVCPLV